MLQALPLLLLLVAQQGDPTATPDSRLELNDGTVNCVAFSPDDRSVAACGDRFVQIFDIESGKRTHDFAGHTQVIHAIAFSRNGRRLVSASDDNTIRLWQVRGEQESASENGCLRVIAGYAGPNYITKAPSNCVAFSQDGRMLVSSACNERRGGLMLWTVETGQWEYWARLTSPIHVTVSPSGNLVAAAERFGRVSICEWTDFGLRARFGPWTRYLQHNGSQSVTHVAFSPDERKLVSVCLNSAMRVWDVQTGDSLHQLGCEGDTSKSPKQPSVSEADRDAASTMMRKFDREKDGVIDKGDAYFSNMPSARAGVWFQHDADQDKLLTVEELANYQSQLRMDRERAATSVVAAEFLPDNDHIVSVTRNGTIKLWNVARGTSEMVAHGSDRRVSGIALAPDGKTLATCGSDGVLKLWSINPMEK